jgi:hypothetical protein
MAPSLYEKSTPCVRYCDKPIEYTPEYNRYC